MRSCRRHLRLLAALLFGAALLGAAPAIAGKACTGSGIGGTGAPEAAAGIGGTGAPQSPGSGIGGTGHAAPDDGIGGTGAVARDEGIGGTGIVGIITGFGSICVNGVEVHYDAATPVDANGQPVPQGALAIGQVVAVNAAGVGSDVRARSISIVLDVVGPVTRVLGNGRVMVMGQTVELTPSTVLAGRGAGLNPGEHIQVSGLRRGDGTVVASHVSPAPPGAASVTGELTSRPGGGHAVHGVAVELPAAAAAGGEVRISGQWNGQRLVAREVVRNPVQRALDKAERLELQGYVDASGPGSARVAGKAISLTRGTQMDGGALVRVSAVVTPDRRILGERVTVEQPARADGDRPGRSERTPEKTETPKAEKADKPQRTEKPAKAEPVEKADRPAGVEKPEKVEKPAKIEKPEKAEKPEKVEKPEKIEKPEKMEKPEKVERSGRRSDAGTIRRAATNNNKKTERG